uniref:G-protein coupled receptors family 1 profile domain-containing protein n=1 Tax=Plectus sambesii TaxID=2011161 RepID=A0A914XKT3_9BILA
MAEDFTRQMSRWDCVWAPHFVLLTFSSTAQVGMLLLISVDRYIAISHPFKYSTFTRKYSLLMVGMCFGLAGVYTATMIAHVFFTIANNTENSKKMVSALCLMCDVDKVFNSYFYIRVITASLSVIIYFNAWYIYRKYNREMVSVEGFLFTARRLQQFQCRITTTVGICALFTFGLYILPNCLIFLANQMQSSTDFVAPVGWLINCCNFVVNIFVYSIRHQDIRDGLKLLFTGRELMTGQSRRISAETAVIMIS